MSSTTEELINAGEFGAWLLAMRAVLRGESDAVVPCGDCVGCCISSYPIPLRPGDELARAEVPEQMLIGRAEPGKNWLMGYREDGSCPFLVEGCSCSIYARRPQTCRDYDCRIYAAAGLIPDGERPVIQQRVKAWRFHFESSEGRAAADAMRRAAQFIRAHNALFPPGMRASSSTAAAVLAVKTCGLFQSDDAESSTEEMVRRVVETALAFDRSAEATLGQESMNGS